MVLGYWAYGYMNEGKIYIYSQVGGLFMHKLIMGTILGWALIPLAIIKLIFRSR
jgi:hypothetical protein